jgi:hypothetical protein
MTGRSIDLNPGSGLRVHFEAAVEHIPGVEFHDVSSLMDARTGAQTVMLTVHGWSPSLHGVTIDLRGGIPHNVTTDLTHEQLVGGVIRQMADALLRQLLRARDAAILGATTPLPNGEIDHLLVDSGLAALMNRKGTRVQDHVRHAVGTLHMAHVRHHGGASLQNETSMVAERDDADSPMTRFASTRFAVRDRHRKLVLFHDAPDLELVQEPLPDTVLAALVGSPVGRIARIDPTLDDRIVRKAENAWWDGRSIVRLSVDQHLQAITPAHATAMGDAN